MSTSQIALSEEFDTELDNILNYWKSNSIDETSGGFVGRIDEHEHVVLKADKGAVLNARILWSFSAAYNLRSNRADLDIAHRSYSYIKEHFIDKEFGGVYWTVDFEGRPRDRKKQVYAIAFTIYGLAEYYLASKREDALTLAKSLYADIEKHSFDNVNDGYFEAFAEDWSEISDLRLSDKDANEKKTMNTHLHILEAYTTLYKIWPDNGLRGQLVKLFNVFKMHIINRNHHLDLFFDEYWNSKSDVISYGHDIEASWLLLDAAKAVQDKKSVEEAKKMAVKIAIAAAEGIDNEAMVYELKPSHDHLIGEKHWWVQAEAMVGFLNAFDVSGEKRFYEYFLKIWHYTKKAIIDGKNGEWYWGRNADGTLMAGEDKAGLWKCPYHNARACIEIISRMKH